MINQKQDRKDQPDRRDTEDDSGSETEDDSGSETEDDSGSETKDQSDRKNRKVQSDRGQKGSIRHPKSHTFLNKKPRFNMAASILSLSSFDRLAHCLGKHQT
jgi:hypothetical protein